MILIKRMGIRGRLLLLIAAAMAPLMLLIAGGIAFDYQDATSRAQADVSKSAELAAMRLSEAFEDARATLSAVRMMPQVAAGGAACEDFLAKLQASQPQILTMGVLSPDGTIVCHNKLRRRQAFGDADLARRIMLPGHAEFLVGTFMIGKVSHQPTVAVAMELPQRGSQPEGSVFLSLNLNWISDVARQMSEGGRRSVLMADTASGRVLARWPDIVTFGAPMEGTPLLKRLRLFQAGGVVESVDLDGSSRLFGVSPIVLGGASNVMVALGVAKADITGSVQQRGLIALGLTIVAVSIAAMATWWLGYWTQLRPIGRLKAAADRLGSGAFETQVAIETWQAPEFRTLGASLNAMAEKLAAGREAEKAVAASEARYRLLAENTADMITAVDAAGQRIFVSDASRELVGREPAELLGKTPEALVHPDDVPIVRAMLRMLRSGSEVARAEYRVAHRDGHYVWVDVIGRPIEDNGGLALALRDITDRKLAEERLAEANRKLAILASTDELTGLANRREFDRALDVEFARSRRDGSDLSLILIDVDRFKIFNDTYGHPAGDACLKAVAGALGAALRRHGDVVARYGGEELVALLPGTDPEGAFERAEVVRAAAERLAITHDGSEHGIVTISVGVATIAGADRVTSAAGLIKLADKALYEAKHGGRNRVCQAPLQAITSLPVWPRRSADGRR
ncbi:sensor domain-containing diguanylate cyclase [Mangrovicella endophytica]|uniref:sensor domain-containing diguanylate cyclase n=1 Tax=Mangrovicella endophytica TaxID=2066697 RepID=UPI0018E47A4D|nr:diguanylate cyclase [Mangrovicella endophytica]